MPYIESSGEGNSRARDEPNDKFDSAEFVSAVGRAAESTDKWKEVAHGEKMCLFVGVLGVFEGELGVTPAKTSQLH